MRYVIVGAGPAGVIAAETVRRRDPRGEILLLHGEAGEPYSRMAIPYLLSGGTDADGTRLRKSAGHYERLGIKVRHARVAALDPQAGRLSLDDGGTVPFDRLLLATGAHPVRPPIDGINLAGVHPCWTLEDAHSIAERAAPGNQVVLLGAGFIGSIILEALAARRVTLTVVEMAERMVPRMLNATAGGLLKRWCEDKGVRVLTGTSISRIEAGSGSAPLAVGLADGGELPAHLVVIAAGVAANTGFLAGSGIATGQGILADRHLRTSQPHVYAAGDVAEGPDLSTGGQSVHAIQPTAADHGRIAAINMTGGEAAYSGSLAMNVLDTLGLISCSFGLWQGAPRGEAAERLDSERFRYASLQFDGDRLVGATILGRTEGIGAVRGLIQSRIRLGKWKNRLMADPQRIDEAYVARAAG